VIDAQCQANLATAAELLTIAHAAGTLLIIPAGAIGRCLQADTKAPGTRLLGTAQPISALLVQGATLRRHPACSGQQRSRVFAPVNLSPHADKPLRTLRRVPTLAHPRNICADSSPASRRCPNTYLPGSTHAVHKAATIRRNALPGLVLHIAQGVTRTLHGTNALLRLPTLRIVPALAIPRGGLAASWFALRLFAPDTLLALAALGVVNAAVGTVGNANTGPLVVDVTIDSAITPGSTDTRMLRCTIGRSVALPGIWGRHADASELATLKSHATPRPVLALHFTLSVAPAALRQVAFAHPRLQRLLGAVDHGGQELRSNP